MRARDGVENIAKFAYNWTLGFTLQPLEYRESSLPPNPPQIMDALVHQNPLLCVDSLSNLCDSSSSNPYRCACTATSCSATVHTGPCCALLSILK